MIMRRFILVAVLIIISQTALKSQDTDLENNAEVRSQIESIFENIDKSRITTGLLRDYATDLVDYSVFDGSLNEENIANLGTYEYILRSVRTSAVTSTYPFGSVSDIMDEMSEATTPSSIPISIIAYKYNYVVDNAITDGLFQRIGDKVYDVYDDNQNWVNPYQESYVVSFAPSMEVLEAGSYTFNASRFTFTNLNLSSIELDAADGLGYRSLSSGITVWLSGGTPILKLKLTLADGVVLYAHTQIVVQELSANMQDEDDILPNLTENFTESASDGTISASASVKYAPGHTSIVSPFILVEGFDAVEFGITDTASTYYGKGSTNLKSFMEDLSTSITDKYDIVYVDWYNCDARIEDNAKLLVKIVNWVNSQKTGNEYSVIMGQSMGGLITRYALCSMEKDGIPHKVGTFVSQDVPYLGVNVPIGMQYAITDLIKNVFHRNFLVKKITNSSDAGYNIKLAEKYLHSAAARQMLLTYIDKNGNLDNSLHQSWQAKLKSIGFPKGDADAQIKNIAISNGGINDFKADTLAAFYGYLKPSGIKGFIAGALFGNAGAIFNSMLIGKHSNVTMNIDILPFYNPGDKVYSALIKYRKNIKWFRWKTSNTLYSRTKYAPSVSPYYGYDKANGSYYATYNMDLDEIKGSLKQVFDSTSVSVASKILFVPTASSLCIGKDNRTLSANDYNAAYTSGYNADSPFMDIYIYNSRCASSHIQLKELVCYNWICKWADAKLDCKFTGPLCPKTNDRYIIQNYEGPVEWSSSDKTVATIDENGKINVKKAGFVTIKAIYSTFSDSIRVMTGIPKFTLTSTKSLANEGYKVEAHCENSEILDFITSTNFKVSWGVKYGSDDIVWNDDDLGIQIGKCSYTTTVNTGQSAAYVYFKPYNDTFVGDVSMVYCSKVPIKKPIEDTFIVLGNGSLLASNESAPVETKSQNPESVIIYKIGDIDEFSFDHVPTATEFCKRMAASERIRELLKDMKPWGELDSMIIPVIISAGDEVYEGTLKCIYKKSL